MSCSKSPGPQSQELRPLSDVEKQLLSELLSSDFAGRDALVKQMTVASVREIDPDGSLEFAHTDLPPAGVVRRVPVEGEIEDTDGVTIHLLLHVVDGVLKELEVYRDDSKRIQRALAPEDLRTIIL